jgi:hypothetical protein
MIHEIVQCYADMLYLKTMLRLPPHPVATTPQRPEREPYRAAAAATVRSLRLGSPGRFACTILAALQLHFERIGTSAPLSSKRTFRRSGG